MLLLSFVLDAARAYHVLVIIGVNELDGRRGLFLLFLRLVLTFLLLVLASESGSGLLTSICLLIPVHAEPDEVLRGLLTLGLGMEEHVVEDGVDARARVLLVTQHNPSGALVIVVLREGRVPDVLEPETGHPDRIEALNGFVLAAIRARTWLAFRGDFREGQRRKCKLPHRLHLLLSRYFLF